MAPSLLDGCNTQILTLTVDPTEEWKVLLSDEFLVEERHRLDQVEKGSGGFIQFATEDDEVTSDEEFGDDPAEEGRLKQNQSSGAERQRRLEHC